SLDDRRTAAHNRIKDALAAAEAAIESDPALTAAEKADQKAKAQADAAAADKAIDAAKTADDIEAACKA
ncbi:DUF1542 domain-containing protein, partial [Lactobacillus apis]|uniref:DUF1542 domain-containing protein n=1 Tax=Lactobacillus apis TaxID=303541 RepID=UPI00164F9D8E